MTTFLFIFAFMFLLVSGMQLTWPVRSHKKMNQQQNHPESEQQPHPESEQQGHEQS